MAEITTYQFHMSVDGAMIVDLARERFYEDGNLKTAMDMLDTITRTDQITEKERKLLCLEILMGEKNIVGVYPEEEFKIVENELNSYNFVGKVNRLSEKIEEQKKELDELTQKFLFICDNLEEYQLKMLDRDYEREYGERMFKKNDIEECDVKPNMIGVVPKISTDVDDYISRMMDNTKHSTEDYGWLAPDGKFYEVDWGEHNTWAMEWLEKNAIEKYNEGKDSWNFTDKLIELHWVLLDNPALGIARPRYGDFELTKAQKEFLYDYYIERNRSDIANSFWQE